MNFKKCGLSRKMKHGSASVGIASAVICAVILLNVLVTALCSGFMVFTDTTPELLYTLDEETEFLLEQTLTEVDAKRAEDDPVQVEIIFCADPDQLLQNDRMRPIYYTALQMENQFSENIQVTTIDVWDNPSAVDAYRANAYSQIYPSYVIVSSGSEFRLYTRDAFYLYTSSDSTEPYAYSGEKTFVKGIMAVTRAEAPICALTVNHGEPFATEEGRAKYSEFLKIIEGAGYDLVYLDLEKEEIPENCRLIITFDPQKDFVAGFQTNGVSESSKLDDYLRKSYAYMVFADADTPKLTNLEEYLEEWGIVFNRYESGMPYAVIDPASALNPEDGKAILAQYETEGAGGAITKDMRQYSTPPKIVFGNALSISYSHSYEQTYVLADEEQETGAFIYGDYNRNMIHRSIYDVFRTTNQATASAVDANGEQVLLTDSPFRLMTITQEEQVVSEGMGFTNASMYSHVCAFGSVDFADNKILSSGAFGNSDVLLSLLRTVGKEVVPVGLDFKVLYDGEIDAEYMEAGTAVTYTVILIAIPAAAISVTGTVVLVKRKFRK
ncbi:MAG: Gldg family protein [Clostridia bacterium]|nr:Gldg family protein [Clostridia bacterium]